MAAEPNAVYYADADYASPARRAGAWSTDLLVLFVAFWALGIAAGLLYVPRELRTQTRTPETQKQISKHIKPAQVPLCLVWMAGVVFYHVALRRLRGGTLGYRIMGIRLIDKTGEAPAWRVLVKRFGLAILFIMPLGASYFRCRKSSKRQAMHDLFCGTWLVRKKARPAGPAMIAYLTRLLGTYPLGYIDVEPFVPVEKADAPKDEPAPEPNGVSPHAH